MPKRIDIGTDIATIGVWDPAHERHDLKTVKFAAFEAGLQSEARNARLFFINTGADGGYLTDFYVNEEPDAELLAVYSMGEREYLITSESGNLIAGGIEDFVRQTKQITSDEDRLVVSPGLYAIRVYELIEERLVERIRSHIGEEDYNYYEQRWAGVPWGCLIFAAAVLLLFAKLWFASVALFLTWVAYLVVTSRLRAADQRFQDISQRISAFDTQYPPFIYVLRSVSDRNSVKGGWYDLN